MQRLNLKSEHKKNAWWDRYHFTHTISRNECIRECFHNSKPVLKIKFLFKKVFSSFGERGGNAVSLPSFWKDPVLTFQHASMLHFVFFNQVETAIKRFFFKAEFFISEKFISIRKIIRLFRIYQIPLTSFNVSLF